MKVLKVEFTRTALDNSKKYFGQLARYIQDEPVGNTIGSQLLKKGINKVTFNSGKRAECERLGSILAITLSKKPPGGGTAFQNAQAQLHRLLKKQFADIVLEANSGSESVTDVLPDGTALNNLTLSNGMPASHFVQFAQSLGLSVGFKSISPTTPISHDESSIFHRLSKVPNAARKMYKGLCDILPEDGKVLEVFAGTGGQFEFYTPEMLSRIITTDCSEEAFVALPKQGIEFFGADAFQSRSFQLSKLMLRNRLITSCIGTNGIYLARTREDLDALITNIDRLLTPSSKVDAQVIFQVVCGDLPKYEVWGETKNKAWINFSSNVEEALKSNGYITTVMKLMFKEFTPSEQLNNEQRDVYNQGYRTILFEGSPDYSPEESEIEQQVGYKYSKQGSEHGITEQVSCVVFCGVKKLTA